MTGKGEGGGETLDPSLSASAFDEALRYLGERPDFERGGMPSTLFTLDRIWALLEALGRPERRYRSVLIGGTKGKGSTAAMVERALRAAGHRTGLYTQPHLHTIRERVRVDGTAISPEAFAKGLEPVRRAAEPVDRAHGTCTAYEIMTALALSCFAERAVDVAVLEVGLGGRLDATNTVGAAVSVLTSISLDHTQILGDTVRAIAAEKADIIKLGRPCVSAPQRPEAMEVIQAVARKREARLVTAGVDGARWERRGGGWDLVTARGEISGVRLSLRGAFQRVNAAVAATVLDVLDQVGVAAVSLQAARVGLEDASWPGRFEIVAGEPTLVIDGAHNVNSAERLREALEEEFGGRARVYVLGIAGDKDIPGIVGALCSPVTSTIIATRAAHPRAADPEVIAATARSSGARAMVAPTVKEALEAALDYASADGLVVVAGSLYVAAEAREALGLAEPDQERSRGAEWVGGQ